MDLQEMLIATTVISVPVAILTGVLMYRRVRWRYVMILPALTMALVVAVPLFANDLPIWIWLPLSIVVAGSFYGQMYLLWRIGKSIYMKKHQMYW